MKKIILLLLVSSLMVGCGGPIAMLTSSVGFIGSSDTYVRAYNGVDLSTTLITKKDIKTHLYETAKATVKIIESKNEVYEQKELPNTLIVKTIEVKEEILVSPTSPKPKVEKQSTAAFKLCYLSFCLAISIGVLMFVLGYGFLSLSRIKRPRKVKKKIKIRKRKIKKRKGRR